MMLNEVVVPRSAWQKMLVGNKDAKEWLRLHLDGLVTYEHLMPVDDEAQRIVGLDDLEEHFILESITLNTIKRVSYAVD